MEYLNFKYVLIKLKHPSECKIDKSNVLEGHENNLYKSCFQEIITKGFVISSKNPFEIFNSILDKVKNNLRPNNFYAIINDYTGLMCEHIYYMQKNGQVKILPKNIYLDRLLSGSDLKIKKPCKK